MKHLVWSTNKPSLSGRMVGFHLFVSRAKQGGKRAFLLFARRLLILFVFGIILHFFFHGEILSTYAIIGLLVLPFFRVKPPIVLFLSIACMAGTYLAGHLMLILSMFLMGLWAGQIGLFQQVSRFRIGLRITLIAALLLIVPLYIVQQKITHNSGSLVEFGTAIGGLPLSTFYVMALTLLLQKESVQRLFTPLKYLGRMALTNYLMHTVIIVTLSYFFGWDKNVHVVFMIMIASLILIVQMVYSPYWLKRFGIGPMEYVWRLGTYGEAVF